VSNASWSKPHHKWETSYILYQIWPANHYGDLIGSPYAFPMAEAHHLMVQATPPMGDLRDRFGGSVPHGTKFVKFRLIRTTALS
jgi:hypothetical protein